MTDLREAEPGQAGPRKTGQVVSVLSAKDIDLETNDIDDVLKAPASGRSPPS